MTGTVLAVAAAAVAAFLASGAYYTAVGDRLAALSPAYAHTTGPAGTAGARPSAAATAGVELARNVVLAGVLAWLVAGLGVGGGLALAPALWVAFPVVLLAGSVFHEKVPATLAAIHAGDWLIKLVLMTLVLTLLR